MRTYQETKIAKCNEYVFSKWNQFPAYQPLAHKNKWVRPSRNANQTTAFDPGHHTGMWQKHHTQENQEVSPFPAGDHKAAMNRQESMTNTKNK